MIDDDEREVETKLAGTRNLVYDNWDRRCNEFGKPKDLEVAKQM